MPFCGCPPPGVCSNASKLILAARRKELKQDNPSVLGGRPKDKTGTTLVKERDAAEAKDPALNGFEGRCDGGEYLHQGVERRWSAVRGRFCAYARRVCARVCALCARACARVCARCVRSRNLKGFRVRCAYKCAAAEI